jgi:hypothetical protein
MARASIGKEIHCTAKDETGLLGRIVVTLSQQKIFILHLLAYTAGETGHLQFVVKSEDLKKAREAVAHFIPKTEERDVLIVEFENKVGTLAEVAKVLGQNNISIRSVYGTSADGFKIVGIFSTADNEHAAELINQL